MSYFYARHRALAAKAENFRLEILGDQQMHEEICQVLDETGRWHRRDCPLKPPLVIWTLVAMCLYRSLSIQNVFRLLMSSLKSLPEGCSMRAITPEAIWRARERLGPAVVEQIFRRMAARNVQPAPSFLGLRVWGIDGSKMEVTDSPANLAAFGKQENGRSSAASPQILGVFLVDVTTHQIRECVLQGCRGSERAALDEVTQCLGDGDLLILDRGYPAFNVFSGLQKRGIAYLSRISRPWQPVLVTDLGDGDQLVDLVSRRKKQPTLRARLISYSVNSGETIRLLTNLLDQTLYPALELANAYRKRWECELAFDEMKTHLNALPAGKSQTTFRSKTPDGVRQEAWTLVLTFNLLRGSMLQAADPEDDSLHLSFTDNLELIRTRLPILQAAGPRQLRKLKRALQRDLGQCYIDRPRRSRSGARKVKRKMSNFHLKRPGERHIRRSFTITLVPP